MRGVRLLVFSLSLCACSLLVQFDPEMQPCDSTGACLQGYACVDARCRSLDAGSFPNPDAGCSPSAELCSNGQDDDCDGLKDCADPDCATKACDDQDACTTGDVCSGSTCQGGARKPCTTPGACQSNPGTCEPTTGQCTYVATADGTACGAVAAQRCCGGQCVNITAALGHCGGCGLSCSAGQVCQSINGSDCGLEPFDTSGRCSCGAGAACPMNQTCSSAGYCVPTFPSNCASGQTVQTVPGCQAYCGY